MGLLIKKVIRIGKERYVHRIFNDSKIVYNYDLKIRQEMNIEIRREKNLDSEGTSNKSMKSLSSLLKTTLSTGRQIFFSNLH